MIEFSKQLPHRGHVDKIYEWCKKKYGRSKYNGRYPEVVFRKGDYYDGEEWGYYDEIDQCIYINKDKHETLADLVDTVIHEYTHYLQNMYHYQIISKYLEHHEHPMEIVADAIAQRDGKECVAYLKSQYPNWKKTVIESTNSDTLKQQDNIYCQLCSYTIRSIESLT